MNQIQYSSESSMFHDLTMWMTWKKGESLTLAHIPKVTEGRWQWITDNWTNVLKPMYIEYSSGNEYLDNLIRELDNNVRSWKLGSGINPLSNTQYFDQLAELLLLIPLSSLGLTEQEKRFIAEEYKRVALFTSETFKAMLRFLQERRDGVFDRVGLGDDYYSSIRGRSTLKKYRDYTLEDLEYVQRLMDMEAMVLGVILDFKNNQEVGPDLLEFAQGELSDDSEVAFQTAYQSYMSVPFQSSLEQMAADYLGDKLRWYELVTVNNLKPPYIDRYGNKELLLETGAGLSVHINASFPERMRVGASVKVGSSTVPEEIRKVQSYTDNRDGTATLLLDGRPDLSKLKSTQNAYVRLYRPETIQEFSFVKIPFTAPIAQDANIPDPELQVLKNLSATLYAFGVDMALSEDTGDLMIAQDGDIKLRYGMAAVRQALWNALRISRGQLPLHPDYGIPEKAGDLALGGDVFVKFSALVQDAIMKDTRFTRAAVKSIDVGHTESSITMSASVAGDSTLMPFSFAL